MAIFKGAGVAIVTPMKADGEVNYDVLGEMLEAQIQGGTDAIIICGTTGESATLTEEEHSAVIRYAIKKVNKRIPVIAGTGSNCTATAIKLSKEAEKDGADGIMGLSFPASLQTRGSGAFLWAKRSFFSEDIACAVPYSMPRTKVSLSQSQSSEDTNADSSGNLPDTDKPYRLHQLWPRQAQGQTRRMAHT